MDNMKEIFKSLLIFLLVSIITWGIFFSLASLLYGNMKWILELHLHMTNALIFMIMTGSSVIAGLLFSGDGDLIF